MGERGMSYEIEQAALSSLLNGGWFHGGHALTAQDFTHAQHRAVFLAIKKLADAGDQIDMFTVADQGVDVDEIFKRYASAKSISGYVDQLKDDTLQRELVKAAAQIQSGKGKGRDQLLRAQSLLASLEGRLSGEVRGIGESLPDWWQELNDRINSGGGLTTGFPAVDKRLGGLRAGDLIILAGRPAMGKTALGLNIACGCGQPTAFFSLEMQTSSLMDRLAAAFGNIHLGHIRTPTSLSESEWTQLTAAGARIKDLPLFVDDSSGLSIEEIHARARSLKAKQEGLALVVVDYLQLVKASDYHQNREQQVAHISRQAKRMAKDLEVPVILLAQLSRKCEDRADKRPLLSDLRESGGIEQDADVVAFVYRDEVYNEASPNAGYAELIFRKIRQGEVGTEWFHFDGPHQKFLPAEKREAYQPQTIAGPYKKTGGSW